MNSELKCILCCKICNGNTEEYKNLHSTTGEGNSVYDMVMKYFDPMLLLTATNTPAEGQILCSICWNHIKDFYEFQQIILQAQAELVRGQQLVKSEIDIENNHRTDEKCFIKDEEDHLIEQKNLEECCLPITTEYIELLNKETAHKPSKKRCGSKKINMRKLPSTSENDYDEEPLINLIKRNSNIINKNENVKFKMSNPRKRLKATNVECTDKMQMKKSKKSTNSKSRSGNRSNNSQNTAIKEAYNGIEKMREFDAFIAQHRPELECDICHVKVSNFDCLRLHFKKEHQSRCYVKCCGQKFYIRCKFVDHLRLDINPNLYKCDICGRNTSSKYTLTLHKRMMHNTVKKQHECEICHRMFKQKRSLSLHMATHATGSKDFVCKECGKAYVLELQLKAHVKTVHNTNFMCDQCGKTFYSACNLKQHLQVMHEARKYKCMFCNEAFKKNKHFQKHLATHSKLISMSAMSTNSKQTNK